MVSLLALIGLIFLFWYVTKKLGKVAKSIAEFSFELSDYARMMKQEKIKKCDPKQKEEIAEKVKNIKGDQSDAIYSSLVRNEIDDIIRNMDE